MSRKENEMAAERVVKMKEEKVEDGERKINVMGEKEKGKQWRQERELYLLVLQWRVTQSSQLLYETHTHTHERGGCEEHVTELHRWALRVKRRTHWKS